MKTLHKVKIAVALLFLGLVMVSCVPEQETMGDAGQTLIKLQSATPTGFSLIVLDPISTPQSFLMFDIRKDVPNSADLNAQTVVTFQYDDASSTMLNAYNDKNGTTFEPLGAALYTMVPAMVGGKHTFTFAPGDFAKTVTLTIPNAFALDMSKKYAFIYKVTVTSGTGKWSETSNDTLITQILPKNKFDGVYTVTANSPFVDAANGTLTGFYPFNYSLITTGANTCDAYYLDEANDGYWEGYYHPITSGGAESVYGSFGLSLTFDASGTITNLTNYYGTPSNTRAAVLNPAGVNAWDPVTKNISIMYWMKQPSVITTPPNIRTTFDETWTYVGKRP